MVKKRDKTYLVLIAIVVIVAIIALHSSQKTENAAGNAMRVGDCYRTTDTNNPGNKDCWLCYECWGSWCGDPYYAGCYGGLP